MTEIRNVNVEEAKELLDQGAILLDVREDNEWSSGRAPEAIHFALNEVPDHLDSLQDNRAVVCVCRSGARSSRAAKFLVDQGVDAVNLEGGMLAWSSEGEPLVGDGDDATII